MAAEHRYDPRTIEPKWQEVWERERTWEVSNDEADSTREKSYVLEMLPYPSGEPHIGHLKNYSIGDAVAHFHRRNGPARAAPDGLRRVRAAGREPRDQDRRAPARVHRGVDRRVPAPVPRVGDLDRLVARVRHARAALLPLDAVDLPAPVRARAGLPHARPPVNWCPKDADGAGQRAGDRRALRALRHAGRGAPARAVVLPHHRLRRPPAGRPRHDPLARARQDDAAQLDRALRGRRGHVLAARRSASTTRCSRRGRTRCSARRSSCMAPEHPDVFKLAAGHRARARRSTSTSTAR